VASIAIDYGLQEEEHVFQAQKTSKTLKRISTTSRHQLRKHVKNIFKQRNLFLNRSASAKRVNEKKKKSKNCAAVPVGSE
jgi:hypothetical protein